MKIVVTLLYSFLRFVDPAKESSRWPPSRGSRSGPCPEPAVPWHAMFVKDSFSLFDLLIYVCDVYQKDQCATALYL